MDGVVVLYGLMGGVNVDGPLLAMILGKFKKSYNISLSTK